MKKILLVLLGLLIIATGIVYLTGPHRSSTTAKYVQSTTPTLFVHGWGSSFHAEEKMVDAARQAGVTNTVVRADVAKNGQVTFNHSIPADAINPIVEVNLADNKLTANNDHEDYVSGYHRGGEYIKQVVVALEKQHHYHSINLVGHSMGNLEIINYLNDNLHNAKLPQVAHLVAIAGHYNGLMGEKKSEQVTVNQATGKPSWMAPAYRELLNLRKNFPISTAVLNIYGDLDDGSHSDEAVPVNSAKSLKYLVSSRAKSYTELEIHGKNAQHSKLHNNARVNRALIKFLWQKK
ncbi:alpha/beta hydrolase [Pediococcus acidilactici]|uniref:alpha/beta hydrolase n=1 Tax=Pediococcus acidilactici TaxID=1254 RepID=UPI003CF19F7F